MKNIPIPADAQAYFTDQLGSLLGYSPSPTLLRIATQIYEKESFSPPPPPTGDLVAHAAYRDDLRTTLEAYKDPIEAWELYTHALTNALSYFHSSLPYDDDCLFVVPAKDLISDVPEAVRSLLANFYNPSVREHGLFIQLRLVTDRNMIAMCEKYLSAAQRNAGKFLMPKDHPGTPEEVIDDYLSGTPLHDLFYEPISFGIPAELRFSHTHIVAGTGHGKTQLLQHLIVHDLKQPNPPSLVIIDSQGDMISKLQRVLPDYILIDPRNAPQLNVFDINQDRFNRYGSVIKEQVLNGVIDLYDYLFSSLLGAELTRKQSVFFRYSIRLLLALPQSLGRNATILDLLDLMHDPKPYLPAMENLPPIQKRFFETDFFSPGFKQTKEQIRYRLNAILENDTFARMLSAPTNEVDMFGAMNSGKIVLVNTAKDYLKAERSSFLGRLFISLTMNAAFERAAIPEQQRRPTFLYIDEAAEYFDDNIDELLNQARKNKLGVILSHQYLDQCTPALRASLASNTGIKFAGGVSDKDARALASDMRTTPEFILSHPKLSFACGIRGKSAVGVEVPFGTLENIAPSYRREPPPASPSPRPSEPPRFKVGDFIKWEVNGASQFRNPAKIREIVTHQGKLWIFVEGTDTAIPADQATIVAELPRRPPPPSPSSAGEPMVKLHHPELPWKLEPDDWYNPDRPKN